MIKVLVCAIVCLGTALLPDILIHYKKKEDKMTRRQQLLLVVCVTIVETILSGVLACYVPDALQHLCLSLVLMLTGVIAVVDARVRIIPNWCVFPLAIVVVCYNFLAISTSHGFACAASIVGLYLFFDWITYTISKRSGLYIGMGDIKYLTVALAFVIGCGGQYTMPAFLAGFVGSLVLYLAPQWVNKKIDRFTLIAFGPFVSIGFIFGICGMILV